MSAPVRDSDDSFLSIRAILDETRGAVESVIDSSRDNPTRGLTDLLSAVPIPVSDRLTRLWSDVVKTRTAAEIQHGLTSEERLLLDMLLAMYDDHRTYTVQQTFPSSSEIEAARVC